MTHFYERLRNECGIMWHDKRMMFLFCVVPFIMSLLLCGALCLHGIYNIRLAVVDPSPSATSRELIHDFDSSIRFDVLYTVDTAQEAEELFFNGDVDGALILPVDFTKKVKLGEQTEVILGVNGSNSMLANSSMIFGMQLLMTYGATLQVTNYVAGGDTMDEAMATALPFETVMRPWYNPQYSYLNYLAMGLAGMVIQQILLMTVSCSCTIDKRNRRNSPEISKRERFGSSAFKFLFFWIAGTIMGTLVYMLVLSFFDLPLRGSFLTAMLFITAFIASVVGVGMIIGALCKNPVHSIEWSMILPYPCFILTGFSWPFSAMPDFLAAIGKMLPTTYFIESMRDISLIGCDLAELSGAFSHLVGLGVLFFVIALCLFANKIQPLRDKKGAAI